jgi:hypothetical protein
MWRPAVLVFGVALAACWGHSERSQPPLSNALDLKQPDITGYYYCSIDSDGYDYPRFACTIRKVGTNLVLAKLGGSQRIRGTIKLDDRDGFTFAGELYCPWGDCTEPLHGRFKPVGRGGYKGTFNEDSMIVRLEPAPANAFGGDGYGGDAYAGYGYGGDIYGYGYPGNGSRFDSRGRPRY